MTPTAGRSYVNSLISAVGAVVVLAALRDLFHTIWHPTRRGGLSRLIMTAMWRLSHRLPGRQRTAGLVGPLGMVAVVGTWALALVLGWALIYWPHMPESFAFDEGLAPSERSDLLDALYLSLVMLGTLGLGDIAPEAAWLRIAAPVEALVGFVLLSATVAWVLELYPALARRRALAVRLSLLRRADSRMRLLESSAGEASEISPEHGRGGARSDHQPGLAPLTRPGQGARLPSASRGSPSALRCRRLLYEGLRRCGPRGR